MIAEIQEQARKFYLDTSRRPDTLFISNDAWSMVRCELDAVRMIHNTADGPEFLGMRVIRTQDITLFKVAFSAWEE